MPPLKIKPIKINAPAIEGTRVNLTRANATPETIRPWLKMYNRAVPKEDRVDLKLSDTPDQAIDAVEKYLADNYQYLAIRNDPRDEFAGFVDYAHPKFKLTPEQKARYDEEMKQMALDPNDINDRLRFAKLVQKEPVYGASHIKAPSSIVPVFPENLYDYGKLIGFDRGIPMYFYGQTGIPISKATDMSGVDEYVQNRIQRMTTENQGWVRAANKQFQRLGLPYRLNEFSENPYTIFANKLAADRLLALNKANIYKPGTLSASLAYGNKNAGKSMRYYISRAIAEYAIKQRKALMKPYMADWNSDVPGKIQWVDPNYNNYEITIPGFEPTISPTTQIIPDLTTKSAALPGLHLQTTMSNSPAFKRVNPAGFISRRNLDAVIANAPKSERTILSNVAQAYTGDNIPWQGFRQTVQGLLPEYRLSEENTYANYGVNRIRPNMPEHLTATSNVLELPGTEQWINSFDHHEHFPGSIGWFRSFVDAKEPDIFYVTENQSDPFEGLGKVEQSNKITPYGIEDPLRDTRYIRLVGNLKDPNPQAMLKVPELRNFWYQRQLSEAIKRASELGKTKLRFPTRQTASTIEGYPDPTSSYVQPILSRYDKTPTYFKQLGLGDSRIVTDSQGHSWHEIDVPSDYSQWERRAFKKGGILKRVDSEKQK